MKNYVKMGDHSYGMIETKFSSLEHNQDVKVVVGKFCSIAENVIAEFRNHRMDFMTTHPLYNIEELKSEHIKHLMGTLYMSIEKIKKIVHIITDSQWMKYKDELLAIKYEQ